MNEFYNEHIKNRYLDEMENEGSRATIKYIFIASKRAEEILGMDLYNFSKEDIASVMRNMSITSYHTARANVNYISNYITYCIKHGYRENNLNPLDTVDRKWSSQFVDRTVKMHYSYEEFIDLLEDPMMHNGQDQALLFMIWEGIIGEKFSELLTLTFSDVDWNNNRIYVKERNEHISVSEDCIKYLQKAYNQNTYYQFNPNTKEITEKELLPSEFIFKNIKSTRGQENEPVKINVFYKRLQAIKEIFNLSYLTPNAIKQSGMIYMAAQLFDRYREIEKEQFKEIGDKYNWSKVSNNEYEYYNVTLMKYFITRQNLKELYDLDVDIEIREIKKKQK
jgi:integrase